MYRARDDKLGRDVAIKVLPTFGHVRCRSCRAVRARGPDAGCAQSPFHCGDLRPTRRQTASTRLVLELVEGPTLAERIAAGPLAAERSARRSPAKSRRPLRRRTSGNGASRPEAGQHQESLDGAVKVLDFGLAKAFSREECTLVHRVRREEQATDGLAVRHACGHDSRNGRLHEPGTGARQASGQADRYLGVRLRPVPDAHRADGPSTASHVSDVIARGPRARPELGSAAREDAAARPAAFSVAAWKRTIGTACGTSATPVSS